MAAAEQLITANLDVWSSAVQTKSAAGRGKSNKLELCGIKKLRSVILELAVRGLLVRQDPNDEPASELLKKIAAEKAEIVKDGKIKKQKALAAIEEDEKPFELPGGWAWARLTDVYDVRDGTHDTPKYYEKGYPLVTSKNLYSGKLDLANVKYISASDHKKICERSKVDSQDILFAMIGSIGNPVLIETDVEFSIKNVALFKYYARDLVRPEFLLRYLLYAEAIFREQASGAVQSFVSLGKIRGFPIALPPLSEQARIVAKVDELMGLCDQLEQQQETSITAHQTLVQTLLDALTTARERDGFTTAWTRIAEHFDTLFTTEWSIDQLKQTILQLAVMGKLVPQDPNDESALDAYSEIIGLPDGYTRSNKQKIRGKNFVQIEDLATLPEGWGYFSVDDLYKSNHILDYADGNHGSFYPRKSDFGSEGVLFLTAAQIDKRGKIDWDECPRLNSDYAKKLTKGWSEEGDVYFTHNATVGRTAIATGAPEKRFLLGTSVTFYRINGFAVCPGYLYTFFSSPDWYKQAAAVMQQTTRNQVSITKQALFYIALPPVAEQRRIVARVGELMALCDTLKTRLNTVRTTQLQLANAMAERAVA